MRSKLLMVALSFAGPQTIMVSVFFGSEELICVSIEVVSPFLRIHVWRSKQWVPTNLPRLEGLYLVSSISFAGTGGSRVLEGWEEERMCPLLPWLPSKLGTNFLVPDRDNR